MNIIIYILIFVSKIIEISLGTLRLIVVAHGKKWLGAILQFAIALVWVIVTGAVVVDINKDPFKVIVFAIGSLIGSYTGSYIEEKMAIGDNLLFAIIDIKLGKVITDQIRKENFAVTSITGKGKDKDRYILITMVSRKKRKYIVDIINSYDSTAMIVAENAKYINGGYNI